MQFSVVSVNTAQPSCRITTHPGEGHFPRKKSENSVKPPPVDDAPIYDDIGEYVPNMKKNR